MRDVSGRNRALKADRPDAPFAQRAGGIEEARDRRNGSIALWLPDEALFCAGAAEDAPFLEEMLGSEGV